MHLYLADCMQNAQNADYPNTVSIDSIDDLKRAVRKDHISGLMKEAHRARGNFIKSDCIMLDLDNTHSNDPDDWKTIDDICDAFPEVPFYYIQSRNYMKVKTKKDEKTGRTIQQEAREKYHLYFPLRTTYTDEKKFYALLLCAAALFPFFDMASAEPAHFFFGVPDPQGGEESGEIALDDFMKSISKETLIKSVQDFEEKTRAGQYTRTADTQKAFKRVYALLGIQGNDNDESETETRPQPGSLAERIAKSERDRSVAWVKDFTKQYDIPILGEDTIDTNDRYHPDAIVLFVPCPWKEEHSPGEWPDNESVIIVDLGGRINYLCRHNCHVEKGWKDYRSFYEDIAEIGANQEADPAETLEPVPHKSQFDRFLEEIQTDKYEPFSTGIDFFDNLLDGGLMKQTLLLLLAAPATGKTTLMQQVCEKMAEKGHKVIYLNLEMSYQQMLAKSISRRSWTSDIHITATDVLRGKNWTEMQRDAIHEAVNQYRQKVEDNLSYPEKISKDQKIPRTDLDAIMDYLKRCGEHARKKGQPAPIVVLDYLHLVTSRRKLDPKDLIKETVTRLKEYAVEYDTACIAICAVNRDSQTDTITLQSGRDSSNLEYTADYQLALDYYVIDQKQSPAVKLYTENLRNEWGKAPTDKQLPFVLASQPWRHMILRVLKARFGTGRTTRLFYIPAGNSFFGDNEWIPVDQNWTPFPGSTSMTGNNIIKPTTRRSTSRRQKLN